jgi:signal transduction histidine kinase
MAPLLSAGDLVRAQASTVTLDRESTPVGDEAVRLLATPVEAAGGRLVVVVAASTGDRDEALASLRDELVLGGAAALVLASLAGYALTGAALRPVEAMRRRAETITSAASGQRLPVPPGRDEVPELARTLNAMLDRIDAAAERERRFVADASHELRRPVTLLKAEIEVALRGARTRDELEDALRSAVDASDELAHLADDLLVLASVDGRRLELRLEPIRIDDLLTGVARRYELRARAEGRRLGVDPDHAGVVVADRLRLDQALGNLVDNALRHGDGTVTLSAGRRDGEVELAVADEGRGFPPAFAAHAFERFSRADPARTGPGAGLGLSIVEAVAEAHRGRAAVASGRGRGAVVTVTIPASEPPA